MRRLRRLRRVPRLCTPLEDSVTAWETLRSAVKLGEVLQGSVGGSGIPCLAPFFDEISQMRRAKLPEGIAAPAPEALRFSRSRPVPFGALPVPEEVGTAFSA